MKAFDLFVFEEPMKHDIMQNLQLTCLMIEKLMMIKAFQKH
jgi:hypothetical protein